MTSLLFGLFLISKHWTTSLCRPLVWTGSDFTADRFGLALWAVENCTLRQVLVSQLMLNNVTVQSVILVWHWRHCWSVWSGTCCCRELHSKTSTRCLSSQFRNYRLKTVTSSLLLLFLLLETSVSCEWSPINPYLYIYISVSAIIWALVASVHVKQHENKKRAGEREEGRETDKDKETEQEGQRCSNRQIYR